MNTPRLYDIKDAARQLGVAPSTLRYWEREGLVRVERNEANDYRQYDVHDLIEASEIAFYRKLGVPVKELQNYRTMSAASLDDALNRTERDVKNRIAELEAMRSRLAQQRALGALAKNLQRSHMRPGEPAVARLSAIDYDDESLWKIFVEEPWRYGVVIEAAQPTTVLEAVVDLPPSRGKTLWERKTLWRPKTHGVPESALECLLLIDPDGDASNARTLLAQATRAGLTPTRIVGSYLLTASQEADAPRWDYYRAWIV